MKILFLAQHKWPHVGGVEKHVHALYQILKSKKQKVRIITEEDIKYPHIKFLGLVYIWYWLIKNRSLIEQSDIIHCHDVFIWYLPFRFLYPRKPVYTTFHGWEGKYPIPWKNILLKRLAAKLSWGTIAVGKYIEKYYKIKADVILYGGTEEPKNLKMSNPFRNGKKIKNSIVFVGRLEKDTGLTEFIRWLERNKTYKVDFVGDGSLSKECERYGKVHGLTDPKPFLEKAEICVPGGYLSYIEAKSYRCKIMTFYNNPLKRDYWEEIKGVKIFPLWSSVADLYLWLWAARNPRVSSQYTPGVHNLI